MLSSKIVELQRKEKQTKGIHTEPYRTAGT